VISFTEASTPSEFAALFLPFLHSISALRVVIASQSRRDGIAIKILPQKTASTPEGVISNDPVQPFANSENAELPNNSVRNEEEREVKIVRGCLIF
jgi:hypothetical protein